MRIGGGIVLNRAQVPYVAWLVYATLLNYAIVCLNGPTGAPGGTNADWYEPWFGEIGN